MTVDRAVLGNLIEQLRNVPFPTAPKSGALADLHAELADYDGHVAGCLSRLESGDLSELPPGLINDRLVAALGEAAGRAEADVLSAKEMVDYLGAVVRVLRLAGAP